MKKPQKKTRIIPEEDVGKLRKGQLVRDPSGRVWEVRSRCETDYQTFYILRRRPD